MAQNSAFKYFLPLLLNNQRMMFQIIQHYNPNKVNQNMNRNFFIRLAVRGTAIFVVFQIFRALTKQSKVRQAIEIKQERRRHGANYQLSSQKQKIINEAEVYLKNHAGLKLLHKQTSSADKHIELEQLIRKKEAEFDNMIKNDKNEPEIDNLRHEIKLLAEIFRKTQMRSAKDLKMQTYIPSQSQEKQSQREVYYEKI